jgi:hypothetical protein
MVDDVHYADNVFTISVPGASERRFRVRRESVNPIGAKSGVSDRGAAGVNREQPERLLRSARDFRVADANDRGFAAA